MIFDTRTCPESQLQLVMFSIMEYVTGTVQRHWAAHRADAVKPGAPLFLGRSMMLIDEAWHLIRRDETGEYANDLARRARHLGLALIVMSQQLSDFNTEYGKALVRNSAQQLLLAQNPQEIPFIAETVELSEREASELGRLKTVKGRHAQMLWLNGARGHGKVTLRVGPTEYWAFTSDPTEVAIRDETIAEHDGNVWAAIHALARRGTRAHRDQPQEAATMTAATAEPATRARTDARCPKRPSTARTGRPRRRRRASVRCSRSAGSRAGSGSTTLAYLIALAAARQWPDPVLVADTGGPSGGLAACAGVEVPRSLGELAEQLAAGVAARRRHLRDRAGRAASPRRPGPSSHRAAATTQLRELLADAREAHGLTVIDCGTLARDADQIVAAAATHVAWVLPATAHGVERGRRVLDAAPRTAAQRADRRAQRRPPDPGRRCASCGGSRPSGERLLVLVPHLTRLGERRDRRRAPTRPRCPSRRSSERCRR